MGEWIQDVLSQHGPMLLYFGVLIILVLCGIGLPAPEEATFLAAGFAAAKIHQGYLKELGSIQEDAAFLAATLDPALLVPERADVNVWVLCIFGVVGIMLGDSIPFWLGKRYGMSLLNRPFFKRVGLTVERLEKTQEFFRRHGSKTVFVARFVAGLRMPTFFMAATMGVRYSVFVFWDLLGALISCPTSIWLAFWYGPQAEEMVKKSHNYLFGLIALIIAYGFFHWYTHRNKEAGPPDSNAPMLSASTPQPPSAVEKASVN